ncbi:MAG TPA: DUF4012 domain-containing protein [Acidimicrobiales bacterium]|nr:DUF4012 domain-containing protein [Acidimicrobiales bacterium]
MRAGLRRHRLLAWLAGGALAVILILLVIAGISVLQTYNLVKGPLRQAQDTLTQLAHNPDTINTRSGRQHVEAMLATATKDEVDAANEINGSIGLKILGIVPGLHTQRAGLVQLVADLHATTVTATALLHSVNTLANNSHGTDISLPDLKNLAPVLTAAHQQIQQTHRSTSGLWGPIGADRAKFNREAIRALNLLTNAQELVRYAVPFLGGDGPRTYLLVGENNAEMRDEGAPLSYSLVTAANGSLRVSGNQEIQIITNPVPVPGLTLPPGTQAAFGKFEPNRVWPNADMSADFPLDGRILQGMIAVSANLHVDGVIGMDVITLQDLLSLTGPVTVSGLPEAVTTNNATSLLLNQVYQGLAPSAQAPRREEMSAVADAAVHQLQNGQTDLVALARTLAADIGGRHLQLWDDNPSYEQTIRKVGASGAVDTTDPSRTFHLAVQNATATKLDYFVDIAISDTVYVQADGTAEVNTAVFITNHAPAGQPPSFQLGPDNTNSHVSGEYVGRVLLWAPTGSTLPKGAQTSNISESGLLLQTEQDVPVLPGHTAIAQFATVIPHAVQHGRLRLVFVPQPRLHPESLQVDVVGSGLKSPARVRTTLQKTTTLTWDF